MSAEINNGQPGTSSEHAPHVTINRETIIDLDSSNAFEGPEKLLEVWFAPSAKDLPVGVRENGLKSVPSEIWTEMLDLVNCKILSIIDSDHVDAYLLSESSMFVFPHKLILKTCGTTTLLLGLRRMLKIAAIHAGFPAQDCKLIEEVKTAAKPYRVFYSRKNFLFPEKQQGPHRSWKDEVQFLDDMFLNGSLKHAPYVFVFFGGDSAHGPDETLEILMTDLEPNNAKQFYLDHAVATAESKFSKRVLEARKAAENGMGELSRINSSISGTTAGSTNTDETFDVFSRTSSDHNGGVITPDDEITFPEELCTEGHALGTVVSEGSGLSDVYPTSKYPDARVDAYIFTPCGFSANGVIPAPDQAGSATHYFTVHVTPEPQCSYASFETNVPGCQTGHEASDIIENVVDIFKPGRFSITLFESKTNSAEGRELSLLGNSALAIKSASAARLRNSHIDNIPGYNRVDRIVHDLDGYDLVFRYYERIGWEGGAPRWEILIKWLGVRGLRILFWGVTRFLVHSFPCSLLGFFILS
ncbi:hypothetical protein DID88_002782 [Monilinia fructigena]|uniref:adenosylmethionine decarboxylase n=1 Tax=Monilinia fructigena TaxID=38457 RepID=A0A395IPB5_9HELO|nr:hypothetical protein DID88_002782 [Monilinia fructigena]